MAVLEQGGTALSCWERDRVPKKLWPTRRGGKNHTGGEATRGTEGKKICVGYSGGEKWIF